MVDVFTMSSSALPDGTRVVGFRGAEAISRPYVFEIYLTIPSDESHAFDLADGVGAKATLTLDRQDGRPAFAFHGIFSEVSLVHEMDGRALVRALLVPHLWRLGQTFHSRIFTHQSIPDIIQAILEDGGLTSDDYVFKLAGKYKVEEHVCQYQESHLDFISRWMEREGLYYYFEQGDDAEKLVITDRRSSQHELVSTPVRFYALAGGDVTAKECLQTFVCRRRSLPGTVKFKDYDYTKPTLSVSGSAPVSKTGLGEISIHGARFFSPESGKRLAQIRAEGLLAREVVFTGSGTSFFLRAGYTFALEDHPRASFDAEYLAIEVEHIGNQAVSTAELRRLTGLDTDEIYRVDVSAIPASVQFRAEQKTAWPRVYGTEHGVVDGDADSEYAQLDEHGRYLVRFAFDESDLKDGKASTRVRMMQPHGGDIEGWHFPLRKGTEVLFTFLGGDPDRPVIAGVVPNALTPSPVTRSNHTKNVVRTGGRNRIEMEDKEDLQHIDISTPPKDTYIHLGEPHGKHTHYIVAHTDGNCLFSIGGNQDIEVGGDLAEHVGGDVTEKYDCDQDSVVDGDQTLKVGGDWDALVNGDVTLKAGGDWDALVNGDVTLKAGGDWDAVVGSDVTLEAGGQVKWEIGSNIDFTTPKMTINAPTVTINGAEVQVKAGWWKGISGPSLEIFTSKNAIGVQKCDVAAVNMAFNGAKLEATYMALSNIGVKMEKVDTGVSNVGVKLDTGVFRNRTVALERSTSVVLLQTGAFASLAKAFMKIG